MQYIINMKPTHKIRIVYMFKGCNVYNFFSMNKPYGKLMIRNTSLEETSAAH